MKIVSKIIKFIDIFGYSPKILVDNKSKYTTQFGGVMSLIIYVLIVLASINFGQDIYKRQTPTILLNKNFVDPTLQVGPDTVVGFRLFYTGGIRIPETDRLVDVFVLHTVMIPNGLPANVTRYEMIRCSQSDLYKSSKDNITSIIGNPDDYYCLPNNLSLELKGKYGAPVNNHMHVRINICTNTTTYNNCYPDQVIRQKMASFFVSYLYRDSYIYGKDFNDPVKYYYTSNTIKSSSYNFRQDVYLYRHLSFETDAGVITESNHKDEYIQLDSIAPGSTADANTPTFTNVLVGLTNIKDEYGRKYIKLQDIAAKVGGIIKFFMLLLEFIISYWAYVPYLEHVYEKIFDFSALDTNNPIRKVNQSESSVNVKNSLYVTHLNLRTENVTGNNVINVTNLNKVENPPQGMKIPEATLICVTPKTHSMFQSVFRCCIVRSLSRSVKKTNYLVKIMKHYQSNFDVSQTLLFKEQISQLFDYSMSGKEQETVDLFRIWKFYRNLDIAKNSDYSIFSNNKIVRRLEIPEEFIKSMIDVKKN